MKNNLLRMVVMVLGASGMAAFGQGTAFTYQGQLGVNGAPASETFDMTFSLFTTSNAATQVGETVTNPAVGVTNGLFTTTVDFGQNIFTGPARWMEIGVRTNGSAGSFTELTPLQLLTPAPYAIYAESASNLSETLPSGALSGAYANPVTLSNSSDTFTGHGAGVTNVNAALLSGLNANQFWQTKGNSGTPPTTNFVGTTDDQPLELHVSGARALRLEPVSPPNVIGGYSGNYVTPGITGATISGGGAAGASNVVTVAGGTIGGGSNNAVYNFNAVVSGGVSNVAGGNASAMGGGSENQALEDHSMVGGGQSNVVQSTADHSAISGGLGNVVQAGGFAATINGGNDNTNAGNVGTIAGGQNNLIAGNFYQPAIGGGFGNVTSNQYATIAGGISNQNLGNGGAIAGGQYNVIGNGNQGTVGGGYGNQALSNYATVPGGFQNTAGGQYSFAAGHQANAANQGAFVWADGQSGGFTSTTNNSFVVRALGGVGINTNVMKGTSLYVVGNRSNGFNNSMSVFENTGAVSNVSPALRVFLDGGTPGDGALSVSANVTPAPNAGLLAEFGNRAAFVTLISNDGTIYAPFFVGSGGGISGVATASNLDNGVVNATQLDGVAVDTNLYVTAHPLYLRGDFGSDHNHALAYSGNGVTNFPNASVQPDGPVLWGYGGGALGVISNGAQAALSWSSSNVTIAGTVSATSISGGGLFKWNETGGSVTAAPNNGYLVNNSSTVTVTLPASPNVADIVRVSSTGAGWWKVVQNAGQSIVGSFTAGDNFRTTFDSSGSTEGYWQGVASSANGIYLVAIEENNYPYPSIATSTNGGLTWSTNNNSPASAVSWNEVASSWDGSHLIAASAGDGAGPIFTSANYGATWTSNNVANSFWSGVASSATGTYLAASINNGVIYTSANGGSTWGPSGSGSKYWAGVAMSANGQILFAGDFGDTSAGGYIYISTNAGVNWSQTSAPEQQWSRITCTPNGKIVLASVGYNAAGFLYVSYNSGSSWTQTNNSPAEVWTGLGCSADGLSMWASYGNEDTGGLYYSINSGVNWTATGGSYAYDGVAVSADGTRVVGVADPGDIWISDAGPQTSTTTGTGGSLEGEETSATELQYIGSSTFMQISHQGTVLAN